MISKINMTGFVANGVSDVKKTSKTSQSNKANYASAPANLPGHASVATMQALNGINLANTISFTAAQRAMNATEKEILAKGKEEIRIANLLDLTEPVNISYRNTPEAQNKLNSAGLNIVFLDNDGYRTYDISNDHDDEIAVLKVKKDADLPEFTYKQGKFMPEITIKDPSLKGKAVKCLAGSKVVGKNFTLIMPGDYEPKPGKGKQTISFTGRTVITTLNKEARTVNAVDKYMNSRLYEKTIKGDYFDEVIENDPNIVIPAGGFGERFRNITRNKENKPSGNLPTSDSFRVIGSTLNAAASAGIIGSDNDEIIYLSQNHEIKNGGQVRYVDKYKTDGGAIAEGLARDIIRNDRDTIILNADIFTNADITRTYHALKTLPNAGLVIPYYPANPERAKSFGLLGIEKDENDNIQIKNFVEKPKYTKIPPKPSEFGIPGDYDKAMESWSKVQDAVHPEDENVYLANPGMYFLSKQAAKILMAKGILDPKATALGPDVMPEIVKMANEGKLLDEDGNQLKVYTVPLEAKGGKAAVWDDIGTAEAYLSLIKDVARETSERGTGPDSKYYGVPSFVLNDFMKNTDLETGIVYDSPKARKDFELFKEACGITEARGNIFVAGKGTVRTGNHSRHIVKK